MARGKAWLVELIWSSNAGSAQMVPHSRGVAYSDGDSQVLRKTAWMWLTVPNDARGSLACTMRRRG